MSKIVIEVDKNFHNSVKIEAIKRGQSMKDFIVNSMQKIINGEIVEKDFAQELKSSMSLNNSILEALFNK